MIQIDDSGSGSPVGSVGIGVLRSQTDEYYFELIPVSYFQGGKAGAKEYRKQVLPIVARAFERLGVSRNEPIEVCRGDIFTTLKIWLTECGYSWGEAKIEGRLQELVEDSYSNYLVQLGVPRQVIDTSDDYKSLNKKLELWVGESFKERAPVCKQWGKGWQRICARYAV
jgi:hypothetical protein